MKNLNNHFYSNSYKKYGVSAKGVHWNSKESQYIRFEILTSFIKDIETSSIIDVGCGFGEYLDFLKTKRLIPDIYMGIDCEDFMIDIASKRYPKNLFLKCDILKNKIPKADYLICSGALNILPKIDFLKAINKCFKSSNRALIFNFLTKKSLHELEIDELYNYCKKLTNKVSLSEEYLHNDLTIFLEK